jgi:hypothetical protein
MSIHYTPNNTFIFSFVRMNPPTPGHLELIKTMIYKAIELGVNKAYVITSSSFDGKNPLPCSSETIPAPKKNKKDNMILERISQPDLIYKSSVLEKMIQSYKQKLADLEPDISKKTLIQNFNVIVLCSRGSPFGFIYNIVKNDYIDIGIPKINMIFIVGRDRADFLDTVVDTFKSKDYVNSVDGIILEREGMEQAKSTDVSELNIEELRPSEYSGSLVRNLVKAGDRTKFEQVYSQYLTPEDIYKLYETIQIGTQMTSPKKPEEDENPQSRYYDGRNPDGSTLLPIINTEKSSITTDTDEQSNKRQRTNLSAGSKKRNKKTRKNRRKTMKNKRKYSRRK